MRQALVLGGSILPPPEVKAWQVALENRILTEMFLAQTTSVPLQDIVKSNPSH
jgi:hypothetical protein